MNYSPYLGLDTGDNETLRSYISFFKIVPTKFIDGKNIVESMQYSQSFRETVILLYWIGINYLLTVTSPFGIAKTRALRSSMKCLQ